MNPPIDRSESPLLVSVSGIRGIVGESLTPRVVLEFAACYGSALAGKTVVVGRDGRASGEMLGHAAISGLLAVGCRVVDLGIAATPTLGFFIRSTGASGGIQITASHNPPQWNGLKLFRPEGFVISAAAGERVATDYQHHWASFVPVDGVGTYELASDPHRAHRDQVLSLVDAAAIRRCRFRVVLDANHASGAVFGPPLLEALGCRIQVLGGTPDGRFEHPPEPLHGHLSGLCDAVRRSGADVGFALDPDGDRLAVVDEQGRYIGEEYTLALVILHRTAQQRGVVVLNSSTSRISQEVAQAAGCCVLRTCVGEVHVAERMIDAGAVIGGEGNGGVIDPRVGFGRDGAAAMALVLDLLAERNESVSSIVGQLPAYFIHKDKIPLGRDRLDDALDRLVGRFADGIVDRMDGLRIDWSDRWLQVRPSNTEPIVRILCEAQKAEEAIALAQRARTILAGSGSSHVREITA
jgi:phosphomannomutase